jgi:hypothetical protein
MTLCHNLKQLRQAHIMLSPIKMKEVFLIILSGNLSRFFRIKILSHLGTSKHSLRNYVTNSSIWSKFLSSTMAKTGWRILSCQQFQRITILNFRLKRHLRRQKAMKKLWCQWTSTLTLINPNNKEWELSKKLTSKNSISSLKSFIQSIDSAREPHFRSCKRKTSGKTKLLILKRSTRQR